MLNSMERKPLTEEEIDKIWVEHILLDPNVFRYNFARAIKQHHDISSLDYKKSNLGFSIKVKNSDLIMESLYD